jgi:prepilin-type N-terminal cleavage/methylation domain-containing protein
MKRNGFTLIELLVALPIGTVILLVIVAGIFQIMQGRVDISQKSIAMSDIDSAAHWLARDLVQAQTTSLTDGAPPATALTMSWSDLTHWAQDTGSVEHSVSYYLSGTKLLRSYDGEITIIGRYMTDVGFSIDDRVFTVILTSCPGESRSEVTRSFSSEMRTDLPP